MKIRIRNGSNLKAGAGTSITGPIGGQPPRPSPRLPKATPSTSPKAPRGVKPPRPPAPPRPARAPRVVTGGGGDGDTSALEARIADLEALLSGYGDTSVVTCTGTITVLAK